MRAISYKKYGGIDAMEISESSMSTNSDDEILIRVHAASINPYDWKLRNGMLRDFFDIEFPITPGRDGCGEIVAIGKHANWESSAELRLGQRVSFISSQIQRGAMAEFTTVKASGFTAPAPHNMTDEQCAALPLTGVSAYSALVETAELMSGMKVLIHGGSGGVGSIAIQLARHIGAEVYATCGSANAGLVEALGAKAIPYDRVDFTEVISDCDVVVDTVGGEIHEKSYSVLKKGGRLVYLIAKPFNDVSDNFDIETHRVIVMNQTSSLCHVMDLAARGILRPNVSNVLPLTGFREAFQLVETGKPTGKVVVLTRAGNQHMV